MKNHMMKGLLLGALSLAAGSAGAVDYYLAAKAFDKTLPDGTTVPMWGYVEDTGGACYNAANADRLACVNALPTPAAPGPQLTVDPGVVNIRIFLSNGLPEPTSIVITGQEMPFSATNNGPTFVRPNGSIRVGSRNNANLRVRSFGREAAEDGGRRVYVWNNNRSTPFVDPGTYIYHSGTHPQKQVYMGLHGAITKDAAVGEAYPGVAYDNEVVLFYSEIDPAQNAAIVGGTYETSIHYHAKWFLVNGEPYSTVCSNDGTGHDAESGYPCANMVQTDPIDAGVAKGATLLRFLSAAGETHVPTLQGLHMTIHAEDGNPYGWEDTTTLETGAAPRQQYSVMLPPLKTKDAIISPQLEGQYALYDGNGYMTNPTNPDDFDHKDPVGGMLRFLSVGANGGNLPPTAVDDSADAVENRTITINVLANDSDPEGQPLAINSFTAATAGTVTCDTNPGGSCQYTAAGAGTATFSYDVSDGVNISPTLATVTVTVVANAAPVAVDDAAVTDVNTAAVVNVLANDTDANGDTLTIASVDTTGTVGTVACDNATGDCTYTPDGLFTGIDTYTYVATDGDLNSASATVTVTVNSAPGNSNPLAVDDAYSIGEAGVLNVPAPGVLGNDSDADGDPLNAVLQTGPSSAAAFTLNADGSFNYQSNSDFNGDDTFTYVANDGTADSNIATVTIDVTPVNDVPVANDDLFYLNSMATTTIAPAGVLANDTDPENDPLTANLDTGATRGVVTLNADGSFDYDTEPGDIGLGTLATFTYVANDGTADSTPATVTLNRTLSVIQAVCERRNNGNCDWRIEGSKGTGGGNQRVEAWVGGLGTGTRIGRTAPTGDGAWTISVNNSRVNLGLDPIDFRVDGDANAEILDYPPTE